MELNTFILRIQYNKLCSICSKYIIDMLGEPQILIMYIFSRQWQIEVRPSQVINTLLLRSRAAATFLNVKAIYIPSVFFIMWTYFWKWVNTCLGVVYGYNIFYLFNTYCTFALGVKCNARIAQRFKGSIGSPKLRTISCWV